MQKIKTITSTSNPIIKEVANLKKKSFQFLLVSENIILEAIKNNFVIETLFVLSEKWASLNPTIIRTCSNVILINDEIATKINPTNKHNYVFALVSKKAKSFDLNVSNDKNIIFLENVQNPENVGLIVRTMLGLGYDKILLYQSASIYHEKTISASAGNVFSDHIVELDNLTYLEQLKANGYEIIITSLADDGILINEQKLNLANNKKVIVFGNEGQGVSETIQKLATKKIKLAMHNQVDSFNVAISAAIIGYLLINEK